MEEVGDVNKWRRRGTGVHLAKRRDFFSVFVNTGRRVISVPQERKHAKKSSTSIYKTTKRPAAATEPKGGPGPPRTLSLEPTWLEIVIEKRPGKTRRRKS